MQRRIAVRGIATLNGNILCAKLKPYRDPTVVNYWATLGGGIDAGEALIPALEREMLEETGIAPEVGNLLYIQQYTHQEQEHLEFFFHIANPEAYLSVDLNKATHGHTEIEQLAFIDPAQHTILPTFLTAISFKDFNPDLPTQIFNYL